MNLSKEEKNKLISAINDIRRYTRYSAWYLAILAGLAVGLIIKYGLYLP